jgi:hypothetical protein
MQGRSEIVAPRRALPIATLCLAAFACCSCGRGQDAVGQESAPPRTPLERFNVEFEIPGESSLAELSLIGRSRVIVGDGARITGLVGSTHGSVKIGSDVQVGAIVGAGDVDVGDRCEVRGRSIAGGTVRRGTDAAIGGPVQSGVLPASQAIRWSAQPAQLARGGMTIARAQVRVLKPGVYGEWTLQTGSRVTVRTGVYVISGLSIEPNASLIVDDEDGPVQVYVHGALQFSGTVQAARIRPPQFLLEVKSATPVRLAGRFSGVLLARESEVAIIGPQGGRASIVAREIVADPATQLLGLSFPWADLLRAAPTDHATR